MEMMEEVSRIMVASLLTQLKENGELKDFIEFARYKAKEDGMDTDGFMAFLDELQEVADKEEDEEDVTTYCIKVEVKKL